jgi:hypothetical protein
MRLIRYLQELPVSVVREIVALADDAQAWAEDTNRMRDHRKYMALRAAAHAELQARTNKPGNL